jgi:hippurate hydrolase
MCAAPELKVLKSVAIYPHLVEMRRWLHAHPELAFEEVKTAEFIVEELTRLGLPYRYDGKGHSVIAELVTAPGVPFVALRAEMDALPGKELTEASYASIYPGKMHACGHGAHMAMVLGAAALLVETPPPGNVRFVFQPAEESGGGARTAIQDGALEDVVAIFGGHVTHDYETGIIMIRDGVVTSQSDRFRIQIRGVSGHGARPHEATDAIVVASMLIIALQSLVSRETNPLHPTVVTVGRIVAGSAANVIAGEAEMEGTIRTTLPETRADIHNGLRRMAEAAAILYDAQVEIEIREGYPPVVNSHCEVEVARKAARNILGDSCLAIAEHPSMGSEDFSYYLQELPGCFVRFGARPETWEPIALHNSAFDIDEEVLKVGAAFFDEVARQRFAAVPMEQME